MTEPLRILTLEDNPTDAELIRFELEDAGLVATIKVVMNEQDFIRGLDEFSPDLILSDYDLPRYNGALALAEAGAFTFPHPSLPVSISPPPIRRLHGCVGCRIWSGRNGASIGGYSSPGNGPLQRSSVASQFRTENAKPRSPF